MHLPMVQLAIEELTKIPSSTKGPVTTERRKVSDNCKGFRVDDYGVHRRREG